jgi:aryl-alcohol dehydrogenase-like predicted oxidoreductase
MKYRFLGKTGVKVSELCFGTMSFGGIADESMSRQMFDMCRDAGINFFDCANVYVGGKSEEILGNFIKDCRDDVVITSKVYFNTGDGKNMSGASRYHIVRAVEDSLRRLNTEYIDLYFIHRFDDTTPIAETMRVLDDLVRSGKILYVGASNFAAWQIAKANGIADKNNLSRIECIQPMYNLVKRQAEVEILPMAISEQIAVINYSPLGGGLLTGKYNHGNKPDIGRLVDNKMYQIRYGEEHLYDTAANFTELANSVGINPVSLAIAWTSKHQGITSPIIGARNTDQLQASIDSINVNMSDHLYDQISQLSHTPPPATDRNEETSEHNYGLRK